MSEVTGRQRCSMTVGLAKKFFRQSYYKTLLETHWQSFFWLNWYATDYLNTDSIISILVNEVTISHKRFIEREIRLQINSRSNVTAKVPWIRRAPDVNKIIYNIPLLQKAKKSHRTGYYVQEQIAAKTWKILQQRSQIFHGCAPSTSTYSGLTPFGLIMIINVGKI